MGYFNNIAIDIQNQILEDDPEEILGDGGEPVGK
jgi:hypothetical protein